MQAYFPLSLSEGIGLASLRGAMVAPLQRSAADTQSVGCRDQAGLALTSLPASAVEVGSPATPASAACCPPRALAARSLSKTSRTRPAPPRRTRPYRPVHDGSRLGARRMNQGHGSSDSSDSSGPSGPRRTSGRRSGYLLPHQTGTAAWPGMAPHPLALGRLAVSAHPRVDAPPRPAPRSRNAGPRTVSQQPGR